MLHMHDPYFGWILGAIYFNELMINTTCHKFWTCAISVNIPNICEVRWGGFEWYVVLDIQ